jgi:hypothetical protein
VSRSHGYQDSVGAQTEEAVNFRGARTRPIKRGGQIRWHDAPISLVGGRRASGVAISRSGHHGQAGRSQWPPPTSRPIVSDSFFERLANQAAAVSCGADSVGRRLSSRQHAGPNLLGFQAAATAACSGWPSDGRRGAPSLAGAAVRAGVCRPESDGSGRPARDAGRVSAVSGETFGRDGARGRRVGGREGMPKRAKTRRLVSVGVLRVGGERRGTLGQERPGECGNAHNAPQDQDELSR